MKFYRFHQNNTGGSFDGEMGYDLWIEAESAKMANEIAQENGVYFNGCDSGVDCLCCGDRWSEVDEYNSSEEPEHSEYARHFGLLNKIIRYGKSIETLVERPNADT